jgi:hypothetical protein
MYLKQRDSLVEEGSSKNDKKHAGLTQRAFAYFLLLSTVIDINVWQKH